MSVCESCGAKFDPATLPATMTTARILCRPCYDKRQADKYAAKAKSVATSAATKPPAPSAAPAATKAPAAPAVAAKPPVADAHSHAPAAAANGESAHKAGASSFSRHGPKKKAHEPVDKKAALRAESTAVMDRTTRRGMFFALAFVLVAGGVVAVTINTRKTEDANAKEADKKLNDFLALVNREDVKSVEGATGVMKITDASKDVWVGTRIAPDINSLRVRAGNTIQADLDKRQFFDRLTSLEAQSKDVATKTSEELRKMRNTADSLALEAAGFGADAGARANNLRGSLQSLIGTKLTEEAMAFADTQGKSDPRGALQKFAAAEDDVRAMWDKANSERNEQGKKLFEAYLRDLIVRSDKLATEYFTDAVIEQTPGRDLLVGDLAGEWVFKGVKGSTAKIVGGSLFLTGGEADAKGRALNVIGDKEQWRDFVISGEFTYEGGNFTMAFRLGSNLDRNSEAYDLKAEDGKLQPGTKYAFTYRLVGSVAKLTWKDNTLDAQDRDLMYSSPRHGAFGLIVDKGAKVTFNRLLIRELR